MKLIEFLEKHNVCEEIEIENKTFITYYKNIENVDKMRVWICDYRLLGDDIFAKPIRNISPTYVEIFMSLPEHRIFYSPIAFHPISEKTNKTLSKIIKPYDNTGWHSYTGVSLQIFDNKEECIDFYKEQLKDAISELETYKEDVIESINYNINNLKNKLNNF